jgi:DNA-binding NarL/FixJ family response regulator
MTTSGQPESESAVSSIRVFVTDDDAQFLRFASDLLSVRSGMQVVGVARSMEGTLTELRKVTADVLILDIYIDRGDPSEKGMSLEAIPDLKLLQHDLKILVVTGGGWEDQQVSSILAGAHGFLYKPFSSSDLIRAIRHVHTGKVFFDAAAVEKAVDSPKSSPAEQVPLTAEELEFMDLLRKGLSNLEIAAQLNVGIKAVYQRRFRLRNKLGLRSSRELTGLTKET